MLENTSPNLIDYVADAQLVLKKYPINLFLIKKYQFQDKKAVWFIKTSKDLLSLKRYALDEQKWQAMISAYDFLSKKGGNISPLIYTWDNKPWVYSKDYYYILSPWVKGKPANYLNQENVISIAQAVAKIHSLSKNFRVPKDSYWQEYLGSWPEKTRRKQGLLLEYRYQSENLLPQTFAKVYLDNFQTFFSLLEDVSEAFEGPLYREWVKKISREPCLCLNGFSPRNFSVGKDKTWILHIDNICIDLPARDLRKFLYQVMSTKETWCKETFATIMKEYLKLYPLSDDELKILLAELKTPYHFMNITSRYFLQEDSSKLENFSTLLNKTLKLEQSKFSLLYRFWQLI